MTWRCKIGIMELFPYSEKQNQGLLRACACGTLCHFTKAIQADVCDIIIKMQQNTTHERIARTLNAYVNSSFLPLSGYTSMDYSERLPCSSCVWHRVLGTEIITLCKWVGVFVERPEVVSLTIYDARTLSNRTPNTWFIMLKVQSQISMALDLESTAGTIELMSNIRLCSMMSLNKWWWLSSLNQMVWIEAQR